MYGKGKKLGHHQGLVGQEAGYQYIHTRIQSIITGMHTQRKSWTQLPHPTGCYRHTERANMFTDLKTKQLYHSVDYRHWLVNFYAIYQLQLSLSAMLEFGHTKALSTSITSACMIHFCVGKRIGVFVQKTTITLISLYEFPQNCALEQVKARICSLSSPSTCHT